MKKGRYRAQDIKRVNEVKLAERVRDQRIVFSVDVAKETPHGALLNEQKEVLILMKWAQPQETRRLVKLLVELPAAAVPVPWP